MSLGCGRSSPRSRLDLDRVRRRRSQAEYSQLESYDPIMAEEFDDAIQVDHISTERRLLELDQLGIF